MEIARFFEYGGIVMYLLVLAGFAGIVVCVLQFVFLKKLSFRPLIIGSILGAVLLGFLGTSLGLIRVFQALAGADPAKRAELMAMGTAEALGSSLFGLMVAGFLLLLGSITLTFRANAKPRPAGGPIQ